MASCIPLEGSQACQAFQSASISKDKDMVGRYPFLNFVTDAQSFDQELQKYVKTYYVQEKYQTILGCGGIDLTNTTELYARFSTTVICNAIIQQSIDKCSLRPENSRPVCAETCAQFAQAEAYVVENRDLCESPGSNAEKEIRADFTTCALPANALSSNNCIQGIQNEPDNCGYADSTVGLCSYCASGGQNSTDTCCYNSNAEARCANVKLPTITQTMSFPPPTATPTSTSSPVTSDGPRGLSGGAIAGIVIGSIVGALLLAALIWLCLGYMRKRRGSQNGSVFNQPSPARKGPPITQTGPNVPHGYEVLPGGRIARMSALEGHSGDPSHHAARNIGTGATIGSAAGYTAGSRRRGDDHSSSDGFGDSPESDRGATGILRPPPTTMRRTGSLSSSSVLGGEDPQSPISAGGMSSPQGMASQQSEQLPFFKDYYSQDDIHAGDRVAVLWAYQPRAADEFSLERGDMLKVVGIWDDGWATGILVDERAEEWEARRQAQRDSGVSNTSGRARDASPPVSGEIKAFPLVCVCLPEHWRKTIEGDGSTETGSSAHQHTATSGS
ncbi:Carcinoembryonic antigen-related cell adhesion molecule 1 [Rhypophila decipiens]|uniref:Carcinoembryonic antigen-related cell adhesion molecule 1 n=1 Tax=Rhypophila decipiens TaxID=261697 RepID=A0AAN7B5G0_9PEZI|nr:Carcinoembryonic antigen-related cell adhesion molecule 1 [Rhypophila decipiens]